MHQTDIFEMKENKIDIQAIRKKYKPKYKIKEKELLKIDLDKKFHKFKYEYFTKDLFTTKLEWSKRMTNSAGICYKNKKIIRLSVDYHRKFPEQIDNTLVHEMIHLLHSGHGPDFKRKMQEINEKASEKVVTMHSDERSKINYVLVCPDHEVVGKRSNKIRSTRICGFCGKKLKMIKI